MKQVDPTKEGKGENEEKEGIKGTKKGRREGRIK